MRIATVFARVLFVVGCGLFVLGGGVYALTRPYLSDTVERLELDDVIALLRQSSPRYVTFGAELDFSTRIYWTGAVPYWGHCPPAETHRLAPVDVSEAKLRKLLGCRVAVTPAGRRVIHRVGRDVVVDGTVRSKEYVAFVLIGGPQTDLWVQSAAFAVETGDGSGRHGSSEEAWLSKREFTGVLNTYAQALNALPEGFSRKAASGGLVPRPAAFVIDERSDTLYDAAALARLGAHYWVPVKGSASAIFVRVASGREDEVRGSITGVLLPYGKSDAATRARMYHHFEVVTGEELPQRFGLVQYRTAAEYNAGEHGVGWPFVLAGSLVAGSGLLGLVLYLSTAASRAPSAPAPRSPS